jgi:dolichyl-phosphate-mannose-protein mannosyltransferase
MIEHDSGITEGAAPYAQPVLKARETAPRRALTARSRWANARAAAIRTASTHRLFTALLVVAGVLRAFAVLGYRPIFWFVGDSFGYVTYANHLAPGTTRPEGYSLILWLLRPLHSLTLVGAVQHLAGLAVGVLVYAVVRRHGMSARAGSLAAAPVLFDAYQIQVEHMIATEVWFTLAVISATAIALWHPAPGRLSTRTGIAIGLLLGAATTIKSIGLPIVAVFGVCMLLRRVGWRSLVATGVAAAVPVLSYMTWYDASNGQFAMTDSTGAFLWARTVAFADCNKFKPPAGEQWLCFTVPVSERPTSSDAIWLKGSPIQAKHPTSNPFTHATDVEAKDFAMRAILGQPWDYAKVVLGDIGKTFAWNRTNYPGTHITGQYRFPLHTTDIRAIADPKWRKPMDRVGLAYAHSPTSTKIVRPWARLLHGYQNIFFVRGTMLGLMLALGLAGAARTWRRLGGAALLPLTVGLVLLLLPLLTVDFDYRYILPVLPLAALSAALGWREFAGSALIHKLRRRP